MSEEVEHDVFEDEPSEESDESQVNEEESNPDANDSAATSAEQQEQKDQPVQEETVPVSRMKAALADINAKWEKDRQELAQLKAQPLPDPKDDPDGFSLQVRIETSKKIVSEFYADYDEKIQHFTELAKINPALNNAVAASHNPAKMAYDIATRDLELKELTTLKDSDEWKEFQAWRKEKASKANEKVAQTVVENLKSNPEQGKKAIPPNLTRVSNMVQKKGQRFEEDDELFAGAL